MKAVLVTKFGGPHVLVFADVPVPRPAPTQILVRVRTIGLNFADIFGRFGVYPETPKPPFIPGLELCGDVVAVGEQVKRFKGRERVMGYSRLGSHAEYAVLKETSAVSLPPSMSYEEGASFLATYATAYHGLVRLANLRKGEKVLIHAAAGGVGLSAVQLAKHLGAEIFATAGTDEKVEMAKAHGADHAINYRTDDFSEELLRITNGYGVDVVMDSVGGEVYKKSWQLLAPMGRYILFGVSAVVGKGALSRLKAANVFASMRPIFPPNLIQMNRGLFGFNLGTMTGKDDYLLETTSELLQLYAAGVLKPVIGKIFPFEKIIEAHQQLQTRQSFGKIVVTIGD